MEVSHSCEEETPFPPHPVLWLISSGIYSFVNLFSLIVSLQVASVAISPQP